jgi:hypothetical protein
MCLNEIYSEVCMDKHLSDSFLIQNKMVVPVSSFYRAHLSRFHLKTETKFNLRNVMFLNKKMMDSDQNCDSYINTG